jgi:hypothetical protein
MGIHSINKAMTGVDPSAPTTGEIFPQAFGFADATAGVPQAALN